MAQAIWGQAHWLESSLCARKGSLGINMGKTLLFNKKPKPERTGLAAGLNRGFIVTCREVPLRPACRKGKASKRVKLIREVTREVMGFSPYEKRMIELIKT